MESCRIVGHDRFFTILGAYGQFIITHFVLGKNAFDRSVGTVRIGKEFFAGCANQFITRASGERDHLLIHIRDDALRIGHHECIDIRFDQGAGIELLVAQTLIQQRLGRLDLFACRVISTYQ